MIKRGDITDETPPEQPPACCGKRCGCKLPTTKSAADSLEQHASVRAADAVSEAFKVKNKT